MKFFFDESGNFQLPPAEEHRVGIVSGVAIPDSDEAEVFQQFDAFLSKLPVSSFQNGEPKGRLLTMPAVKPSRTCWWLFRESWSAQSCST